MHAADERGPRLSRRRPGHAGDRAGHAAPALVRQHQRPIRVEPLEELAALAGLEPPVGAPPPQQLAHGARQLHPAQARTLAHDLADQRHISPAEGASREPRRRNGHRRVSLPHDTVPKRRANVQGGRRRADRRTPAPRSPVGPAARKEAGGDTGRTLSPLKAHRRWGVRRHKSL